MATMLKFPAPGGEVEILVREPGEEVVTPVGVSEKAAKRIERSLDDVLVVVRHVATSVQAALAGAPVESAEVEFGLQITSKGTVYVFEAGAQATLLVRLKVKPSLT
jgi:hypothetical protein